MSTPRQGPLNERELAFLAHVKTLFGEVPSEATRLVLEGHTTRLMATDGCVVSQIVAEARRSGIKLDIA